MVNDPEPRPAQLHPVQPPPSYYPVHMVPAGPQNGMPIAGLTLGIIATIIALIPFGIFFIWPASVLAIIFGAIGHSKANSGQSDKKGAAVIGWVLGIASMVIAPIVWVVLFAGIGAAGSA